MILHSRCPSDNGDYMYFQVCLGFVRNYDANGNMVQVTPEYIMAGHYEVDIAGVRYSATATLRSPSLPTKFPEPQDNRYLATQT